MEYLTLFASLKSFDDHVDITPNALLFQVTRYYRSMLSKLINITCLFLRSSKFNLDIKQMG